ncbi:hypothetical protein [uncultured Brevundimonas sp.]|uniref:hypothetical protein n=1 Tax=uncultured Brevundimonas sp. TaxID=213418 RepID=UPI0025D6CA3A|nr:hypothetical protein [uncultured Brevundimonas sp.]
MTNKMAANPNDRLTSTLRLIGWTLVAGLLITPAIAMRFTAEVQWTTSDFLFAGLVLIGAGLIAELAVRSSDLWSYRIGAGLAVLASVLLLWINGAVGIIGSEDHPANLLYLGVILAAFVGGVVSRFRADGLSLSMFSAAVIQIIIGIVAVLRGWGVGSENWPRPVIVLSIIFALIWLASATLFRRAARAHRASGLGESAAS